MSDDPDTSTVEQVLDALDAIAENQARERWDGRYVRPPQCCPDCGHHYICHAPGGRAPCSAGRYFGHQTRHPCTCTVPRETVALAFAEWLADTERVEDAARVYAEAIMPRRHG